MPRRGALPRRQRPDDDETGERSGTCGKCRAREPASHRSRRYFLGAVSAGGGSAGGVAGGVLGAAIDELLDESVDGGGDELLQPATSAAPPSMAIMAIVVLISCPSLGVRTASRDVAAADGVRSPSANVSNGAARDPSDARATSCRTPVDRGGSVCKRATPRRTSSTRAAAVCAPQRVESTLDARFAGASTRRHAACIG
jgi:hypothetical protein